MFEMARLWVAWGMVRVAAVCVEDLATATPEVWPPRGYNVSNDRRSTVPVVPPYPERKRMTQPALVIGHKGDWLHNLQDAHALARQLPDARFIEARSILELRLKPDRLYPAIRDFLLSLDAAPRQTKIGEL